MSSSTLTEYLPYLTRLSSIEKKNNDKKKKLLILGFGQENKQFLTWILNVLNFSKDCIIIADKIAFKNENLEWDQIEIITGENYLDVLQRSDIEMVIKAPGIWSLLPQLVAFREKYGNDSVLSSLTFFIEVFRDRIIAITGTKGKTTTSSLITHFLKTNLPTKQIHYCGNTTNISPYQFFTDLDMKYSDMFFVLELSSFQLQDLAYSKTVAKYAVITNYYIDHLDQHADCDEYWQAKDTIFTYQKDYHDTLVYNKMLEGNWQKRDVTIPTTDEQLVRVAVTNEQVLELKNAFTSRLIGDHNWMNIALAKTVVKCMIASLINDIEGSQEGIISIFEHLDENLQLCLDTFEPPKGRLEKINTINLDTNNGKNTTINIYNDNTATEPDAVMAAINTLTVPTDEKSKNKLVLILSGKWKKGNHEELAKLITEKEKDQSLIKVFYCGEVGQKIKTILNLENAQKFESLKEIFTTCTNIKAFLEFGDIDINQIDDLATINILFSPSGSSHDEFNNYVERGEAFCKWASNL
jgi:UDP-N-acetylmuramoylalanine-D-glutamate ligase